MQRFYDSVMPAFMMFNTDIFVNIEIVLFLYYYNVNMRYII